MSDEVDDLLRRAMTTLDHQVPEGYFDTLESRTLARLDDPTIGELPSGALPEEDAEDVAGIDELARARALRQAGAHASDPGAVSPAVAQAVPLPDQRARGNRRSIFTVVGLGLAAAAAAVIFVSTHARTASDSERVAQERPQAEVEASSVRLSRLSPSENVENLAGAANGSSAGSSPAAQPTGTASNTAASAPRPAAVSAHAGSAAPGDQIVQIAVDTPPSVAKPADPAAKNDEGAVAVGKTLPPKAGGKGGAFTYEPTKLKDSNSAEISGGGAPEKPISRKGKKGASNAQVMQGTPSAHDPSAPPPSLSRDDIQRSMTAVTAKVRTCVAGTAGHATVQLTVAPSGQVQKVAVTGAFAGTPAGTCVERAVKAAAFPAWTGEPASFGYDFPLSE